MENRAILELEPVRGTWTPADLRKWRKSRGLIQRDTAALLGLARRTYQYAEMGKTRGGYVITTIERELELACKGLDCEMGVHTLSDQELRTAYSRAVVELEEQAGLVPTSRPIPP